MVIDIGTIKFLEKLIRMNDYERRMSATATATAAAATAAAATTTTATTTLVQNFEIVAIGLNGIKFCDILKSFLKELNLKKLPERGGGERERGESERERGESEREKERERERMTDTLR